MLKNVVTQIEPDFVPKQLPSILFSVSKGEWSTWEKSVALILAPRINALRLLHPATITLADLLPGAKTHTALQNIILHRPPANAQLIPSTIQWPKNEAGTVSLGAGAFQHL